MAGYVRWLLRKSYCCWLNKLFLINYRSVLRIALFQKNHWYWRTLYLLERYDKPFVKRFLNLNIAVSLLVTIETSSSSPPLATQLISFYTFKICHIFWCLTAGSPNYGLPAKSGQRSYFIRPHWHFVNNEKLTCRPISKICWLVECNIFRNNNIITWYPVLELLCNSLCGLGQSETHTLRLLL